MGQNCAGPERFILIGKTFQPFCEKVTAVVSKLQTGRSLESDFIDCGSCCLPQSLQRYQHLVDNAVSSSRSIILMNFILLKKNKISMLNL
jgi:acyl-CoA reductase-like NAD-dependent aldehyde dehydrogenase